MQLAATGDDLILLLAFFGLYLVDCVVLLRPAQALVKLTPLRQGRDKTGKRNGRAIAPRCRFALDFGLTVYPVRGRYLAILNPFTPFVAVFKTRPIDDDGGAAVGMRALTMRRMIAIRIRNSRMSVALVAHGILMFIILPLLLLSGETARLLTALGGAFVSAILILVLCYADRRAARLSLSGFWSIAGQALLCLPTSLNAPRKLALLIPTSMRSPELLPMMPEGSRQNALGELRLTLDRAAADGAQNAGTERRKLAATYPERDPWT